MLKTPKISKMLFPIVVLVVLVMYDAYFFSSIHSCRGDAMEYIQDIRVIHQYCNYALGFISLILGLMIGRLDDVRKFVGVVDMMPFFIALGAAGFCIIFIPVSYDVQEVHIVRFYWMCKVILEQVVVVMTIHGLITITLRIQQSQKSSGE